MSHEEQKMVGRICVVVVVGAALMVATFSKDALVLLGGLAVAFGFQMWVPLAAVCYFPWLTRQGVSWGSVSRNYWCYDDGKYWSKFIWRFYSVG